jgi:urease accessory protein
MARLMNSFASVEFADTAAARVHGTGEVSYALRDGKTVLKHLYQHDPVRILFPTPPKGEPPVATVVTTSGGLVGGDVIDLKADVGVGAQAMLLAQAAEKVYRSAGADCRVTVDLTVGEDAWLEWLPQEAIIFDGARLRRNTRLDLKANARALAGEMLVFGRTASGEVLQNGLVRDVWEIRQDDQLIWADALHLENDIAAQLAAPAGFGGALAMATAVYAGPDAGDYLPLARQLVDQENTGADLKAGATVVNGVLVLRWLGKDAQALRTAFGVAWGALRTSIAGYSTDLPRLWHV